VLPLDARTSSRIPSTIAPPPETAAGSCPRHRWSDIDPRAASPAPQASHRHDAGGGERCGRGAVGASRVPGRLEAHATRPSQAACRPSISMTSSRALVDAACSALGVFAGEVVLELGEGCGGG
jgi:hypothetical protein